MAYYCLLELHWQPETYLSRDRYTRAFIAACIMKKTEEDKKREKELRKNRARRRR